MSVRTVVMKNLVTLSLACAFFALATYPNVALAEAAPGIHVDVDCMNIVNNGAVIGGVITHGTVGGVDFSGQRAITAVVDNGTSVNDPADQISFSFFSAADCSALTPGDFPLNNLTHGQVKVR